MQKHILSINENFSNEEEKVTNLNKLVTNLFSQVYDLKEHEVETSKMMEKITEIGQVTEFVQAKTKELEEEHQSIA